MGTTGIATQSRRNNVWPVDPNDPEWNSDQYDASGSKRVNIWKKDGNIDTNPPLCEAKATQISTL